MFESKIKLNIIILSITWVVRCPILEIKCTSDDHVPIPGWVTPQIFIHSATVDFIGQVLPPSGWASLHLQFFFHFCVSVSLFDSRLYWVATHFPQWAGF